LEDEISFWGRPSVRGELLVLGSVTNLLGFFHPLDRHRWEPQLGSPILPRRREDANPARGTTWDDEGGTTPNK